MAKDMMAQEFSPQEDSYWIRDLCDWSGHKDCWPNAVKDPSVETHTNMHLVPAQHRCSFGNKRWKPRSCYSVTPHNKL